MKKEKPLEEEIIEDQIPEYFKEAFQNMEKALKDKIKREIKFCFQNADLLDLLIENQSEVILFNMRKIFSMADKRFKKMELSMKEIQRCDDYLEDTLRNVLIAIKQNENLQAWYPAQQGYPEMKVTGRHPIVAKRMIKK